MTAVGGNFKRGEVLRNRADADVTQPRQLRRRKIMNTGMKELNLKEMAQVNGGLVSGSPTDAKAEAILEIFDWVSHLFD